MFTRSISLLLSCCAIVAVTTAIATAHDRLAPADEYFGQMQMSPLEVSNRISDAERGNASLDGLLDTQDAIEDWAQKYPDDPWIAPREVRIIALFAGLHSSDGFAEARHCREFLSAHFPEAAAFAVTDSSAK